MLKIIATSIFFFVMPLATWAAPNLTSQNCLSGRESDRLQQATQIMRQATGLDFSKVNTNQRVTDFLSTQQIADINNFLYAHTMAVPNSSGVVDRSCAFSTDAKFDTLGDYIQSLAYDYYVMKTNFDVPGWLAPGFRAVIGAVDSRSSIYIETSKDGFTFYDCDGDDGIRTVEPPHPSNKCPVLLTPQIFIPVATMLKRTTGVMDYMWTVLKAMAGASLMLISGISNLNYYAVGAQTIVNIAQPQPLSLLMNKNEVRSMSNDFLKYGARSQSLNDSQVVTTLIPIMFADLRTALVSELAEMVKDMLSDADAYRDTNNPNILLEPGYIIRKRYHSFINAEIQTDAAAAAASAAAPALHQP